MKKIINWDEYYSKHCARFYGWLPAGKAFKDKQKKKKLKYFTLCDTNAIDIFMFEMEGILQRDKNQVLTDIIICESDSGKIEKIFENVRPPLRESIVFGKVEELLLFEDNEKLKSIDPESDVRNLNLRQQVKIRRDALRLQNNFPFDIINFDPCNSLLRPNKRMYQTLDKIFEFQTKADINDFLLLVTTPIGEDDAKLEQFKNDYKNNIDDYKIIADASNKILGTLDFDEIDDYIKQVSIGFGKTLLSKIALKYGWKCSHKGIYAYENNTKRFMLTTVTELSRDTNNEDKSWYPLEIVNIIENMPQIFTYENSLQDDKVKDNLDKVVLHRDEMQSRFKNN